MDPPEQRLDREHAADLVRRYGGHAHRGHTAAGRAVGIPAVLAGRDLCFQVGRQHFGRQRKDAILRATRRRGELANQAFRHLELAEFFA
jgi:hypothetical protein